MRDTSDHQRPKRLPLDEQVDALRSLALAATRPAGADVYRALVAEVARALKVRLAMVAVFADEHRTTMRTLAVVLDSHPVTDSIEYPLAQSPCVEVVGKGYCFMPGGVVARYTLDSMVADLGLDAYAAFPMNDSRGEPLGLVAALDPNAIAGGDADHAEAVLKIAAMRLAAELERSAVSAALQRSEASYRTIFEAAEDCIFLHDWESGRFLDANPKACSASGYARDELLRLSVTDVSSGVPPYTAQDAARWIALAREGRCPPFEWHRRNKDGSLHWDEVRLKPVTIDGRPHVLAVTRDITERKAAEAERAALESQLRQAQKMEAIGQLTGGIAHDFNNILTSVIGYLVLAQERAGRVGDANLVRQLASAQTAAQRARELIAQMLAFARRQRGDRRVIALAPVVRQTLQLLRSTLPATIVLDDAGLGEGAELPPVQADAVQLEQVLFNLCINARDAIERGGCITVRLHEHRGTAARCASCGGVVAAGHWLRISVSDTGSGIDAAVVSRMFEPFFSTKEIGRGSGMGLAMVHGIVHEHEGHIVVDTAPGRGSSFHVLLPAADSAVDTQTASAPAIAGSTTLAGRVMVVEDEPMVAAFMRELLEGWGLEVVAPADALAAARWFDDPSNDVDLLITDLTMPQLNGLELAHHVGVLRPRLPVVLYSGDAEGVDDDAMRRAGVRERVAKPVDPPRLKALLRRWLVNR